MKLTIPITTLLAAVLVAGCGGSSNDKDEPQDEMEMTEAELERIRLQQEIEEANAKIKKTEAEAAKLKADAAKAQSDANAAGGARRDAEQQAAQSEAEKRRLEAEAAAAEQAKLATEAEDAFTGLAPASDRLGLPSITAKYRAPASVSNVGVTFTSSSGSTAGRWYVTTLSNRGADSQDDMVVYSDVGAPVSTPILEHHEDLVVILDDRYLVFRVMAEEHKKLIKSGRFPRSPSTINIPLTVDEDGDNTYDTTAWFSGTFGGASGSFQCVGGGAVPCSVRYTGANYIVDDGSTWTFRTSKSATVRVDDASYMSFGWWRKQTIDSGAFSYGVFRNTGDAEIDGYSMLEGTATYEGPAIGQYAIYQPLGTQSNYGSFKATARLSANFDTDKISGAVTGFDVNSGWAVTLKETSMDATGTTTDDNVSNVSWTIDGNTEDGGNWNGEFHSEIDPHVDTYPEGVAGTFEAKYAEVGRMVGAFGAHKK